MFIDTHAHLDYFKKKEVAGIVSGAKKRKVMIVCSGTSPDGNRKVLEYCEKYDNVRASLGLFPIECLKLSVREFNDELKFIKENKDKIVSIGEVGLDFKEDEKKHKKQVDNFKKIIDFSMEVDKVLIVHSRKAEKECIEMLEEFGAKKVLMHCFSGKLKLVQRIIDNGWSLSIPTNVVYSQHFQKVIEMTPIEQLFCETDSPFLSPTRKFPNHPENVIESYKMIAKIKKMKLVDVEEKIEGNYERLFG